MAGIEVIPGLRYLPGYLSGDQQTKLAEVLRVTVTAAPLFTPVMPRTGRKFSVRMTNLGPLGWVSDRTGYRYQTSHPETGRPWPAMPAIVTDIWRDVAGYRALPEACLVNYYQPSARMGLHRDEDEDDLSAPVVSVSLGDTAVYRIGGRERTGKTQSLRLNSGDVLVMGGPARFNYHGIDRILPGTSCLLTEGGRINLTLRRVTVPRN